MLSVMSEFAPKAQRHIILVSVWSFLHTWVIFGAFGTILGTYEAIWDTFGLVWSGGFRAVWNNQT